MQTIIPLVRDLINDRLVKCSPDVYEYIPSNIYPISEPNVSISTLKVYVNGVLTSGLSFTVDEFNRVHLIYNTEENDVITLYYQAYQRYSDEELKGWIRAALYNLTIYKYLVDFVLESGETIIQDGSSPVAYPSLISLRLIAMVTSILIDGGVSSYRTPDITIDFSDKESKDSKIKKLVESYRERYGVLDYHYYLVAPDQWYQASGNEDPYFNS